MLPVCGMLLHLSALSGRILRDHRVTSLTYLAGADTSVPIKEKELYN